jgi:AbrB family looped-hinge helix DNA binding protein
MPLAQVREKFQITIPPEARREGRIKVGDFVEVTAEGKVLTLVPKVLRDPSPLEKTIEQSREEFDSGKCEIFDNVEDLVESLEARFAKNRKRRSR